MLYLYYKTADGNLNKLINLDGVHESAPTLGQANERVAYWRSVQSDWPIFFGFGPNLADEHMTDWAKLAVPTLELNLNHAHPAFKPMPVVYVPWCRKFTKAVGKVVRSFWKWA